MFTEQRRGSLARMKNLVVTPKPIIEVTLTDDQKDAFVPQYTSLDEIKGEVSITASCDTSFDDIYITFEGSTRTFVEKIATTSPTNGRTEAFHNFVRLVQPMDPSIFPNPRVIEARKTYKFPFTFVVQETLLPQSCTHAKNPGFPGGGHMIPPPSLGDPLIASLGKSLMDDMAPDMGTIAYSVRCRMTSGRGPNGKHKTMAEGSKKLRIIPAMEEQPPLDVKIEGDDRYDYKMRREKNIKKGIFKGKLGRLVVQSTQPQSLRLPYSKGADADRSPTTMATVNVRFDPIEESSPPPGLNTLQAKLNVATFFTSVPMDEIPSRSSDFHYSSVRGIFVETLNLSSRCLSNIEWQKHTHSTLLSHRAPGIPNPSEAYHDGPFYTAKVVVPVSLPKGNKVFVPSFHSCLVSRIYALDLYLSVNTPNATVTDPTLHLKLPIQVSSEGNPNAKPAISAEEHAAIAAREANAYFDPRSVAPPSPEYTEHALLNTLPNRAMAEIMGGSPQCSVRTNGAQPRFQSLSFEGEEEASAPPPEYTHYGGRNTQRVRSSVPGPLASPRLI
ncbi:MAG: hypothetical protein ALECFALPRED_008766 [Alectoria fallacina]|uniref:Arrestin-like N-terminal domain-containing protein n=1 Tax=Alectoria fallacina TaxID=1903189 RepID=A0A8H3PH67_9LECA|nr:MAG: hypothetical protein ALECFALPRED_008766 [Alectoria fallacina]